MAMLVPRGVSRDTRSIVKPCGEMVAPLSRFEIYAGFCGRNSELLCAEPYQQKIN